MEKIILNLHLESNEVVPLIIEFIRRLIPSLKPEEIRYNLKQAAAHVGESEKSLTCRTGPCSTFSQRPRLHFRNQRAGALLPRILQTSLPEKMLMKKSKKDAAEMITSIFFVLLTSLTRQTCGQSWT
jgi:hypothetical protein